MKVFCAVCQGEPEASPSVVGGDLILTCPCGHFLKVPASLDSEELDSYLLKHKEENLSPRSGMKHSPQKEVVETGWQKFLRGLGL